MPRAVLARRSRLVFRFDKFERRTLDAARPLGCVMLADDNEADAFEVVAPLAKEEKD